MFPFVSVIVPIYNVEQYLRKCLDSIVAQTYTHLEILLVEDGSPDKCGEICDEYARKDKRIKVIHKKNGGLSDARNAAIDVATGEYITFIDSDDFVAPDYVETLYGLVAEYNCQIGVAKWKNFHAGHETEVCQPPKSEKVFAPLEGIEQMFYQELFDTMAWGKIYHRSLFDSGIRYPYRLIYEDLPTTYRLFLLSDKIAFSNRIVYNYLLRADSIEGQPFNPGKLESALKILQMFENHAAVLKPIEKAVRCRLLSFCFHVLLEMPVGYPDERKGILSDYVKANRWKVLIDAKARKKGRIGALVSYLGLGITRKLLMGVKERKQLK